MLQPRWSLLHIRPISHGSAIVPFHLHSNLWNGKVGCSHENGTMTYQFCFVFRRERNSSIDMFSICLFRRERNGTIAHRSASCSTVLVFPLFGTEQFYWNRSCLNATLQCSPFRNNVERSGKTAFPCERSLNIFY